jgi:hypothetical protein
MASKAYHPVDLTEEKINTPEPFRLHLSYGVFSIRPTWRNGHAYAYAYKRSSGKLYKSYVGKYGNMVMGNLYDACLKIANKTGSTNLRDYAGHEVTSPSDPSPPALHRRRDGSVTMHKVSIWSYNRFNEREWEQVFTSEHSMRAARSKATRWMNSNLDLDDATIQKESIGQFRDIWTVR